MEPTASTLDIVLTLGAFLGFIIGLAVLGVWSQRRRRRGDEGSSSNAEGAEVIIGFNPPS